MAEEPETVSVVIPVYRSEKSLPALTARLGDVLEQSGWDYEIVLVDDASPDGSWEVMQQMRAANARVKVIQHMRNFGQHRAILCGLRHARGDLLVTMDDDLQHPPEEIPKLHEAMAADPTVDVAIGAYEVKQHSWFRNLGTEVVNRVTSFVFGKGTGLKLTSFRIMRRRVADELLKTRRHNPRINQLLLMITDRMVNVPVAHHPRQFGRSGYSLRRLVSDALDNILSNSALPLQIVSYLGFGSSLLSFVLSLVYLYKYFFVGISVPGWTTVVLLLLFFFGVLLFSLGVVGEYLIRILREVQGSPWSIVRKKEP